MIVGIDPGGNGAATFIDMQGQIIDTIEYAKHTPHEMVDAFQEYLPSVKKAYIERIASRPGQGAKSIFSFGVNYGFWLGLLTCLKISYELVTPGTWQRSMRCLSRGNKNVTKAKAQQLFPNEKVTHAKADSILIAEYGRRVTRGL